MHVVLGPPPPRAGGGGIRHARFLLVSCVLRYMGSRLWLLSWRVLDVYFFLVG